jgi:hypothetical protein
MAPVHVNDLKTGTHKAETLKQGAYTRHTLQKLGEADRAALTIVFLE